MSVIRSRYRHITNNANIYLRAFRKETHPLRQVYPSSHNFFFYLLLSCSYISCWKENKTRVRWFRYYVWLLFKCVSQEDTDEEEHLVSNESAKSHFRLAVSGLWNGERPAKWRTGSVKVSIAYMSLSLSGCGFDIDEGPRNEVFLSVASGIYRAQYAPCAH